MLCLCVWLNVLWCDVSVIKVKEKKIVLNKEGFWQSFIKTKHNSHPSVDFFLLTDHLELHMPLAMCIDLHLILNKMKTSVPQLHLALSGEWQWKKCHTIDLLTTYLNFFLHCLHFCKAFALKWQAAYPSEILVNSQLRCWAVSETPSPAILSCFHMYPKDQHFLRFILLELWYTCSFLFILLIQS